MLADFFDKKHVVETFEVAFKRGANQRRLRVIMLMIVVMVVIGPMHGEMSVVYLFTRYQFNWSEVEFSFFSTYGMLTGLVGMRHFVILKITYGQLKVFYIHRHFAFVIQTPFHISINLPKVLLNSFLSRNIHRRF